MIDSVTKFSLNGTNSNGAIWKSLLTRFSRTGIADDISIKSANVKLYMNDVCNLISVSSERFN
jgi:hypothetical protein